MGPNDEPDALNAGPDPGTSSRPAAFPGMIASVYAPRCDGCGDCAEACPTDAITILALAEIDAFACTGCGRCVPACPRQAIEMHKP